MAVDVRAPLSPAPRSRTAGPRRGAADGGVRHALGAPVRAMEQVAGMVLLTARVLVVSLTPPFTWVPDVIDQAYLVLQRCLVPMVFSTVFFGFSAPGLQASNFLSLLGTTDRLGAFFVMASVREFAPWITAMVVAGVAGTAICADLGARKVRDELDAMAVMGIDAVRTIVVPRFYALGVMTFFLNILALVFGVFGGWLSAVVVFGETTAGFLSTFASNFSLPDLLGSVLKTTGFGFIVAIVCCYKGMNVSGGSAGVGRAVNQAVVISFVGIWVFNYAFTSTLLAAFPETANLH
ncbi:ABC transporter permease [Conexibacter sp. SYSU D00693]|uniref:MlaE family ABC transporter permease n=1 Tax=Conexibacter sp. SYSU D00693 TaxID=2812560 RepID=UPI001F121919|nr:ABC transporter permease [Conexibacter sp. SYSU D00693]